MLLQRGASSHEQLPVVAEIVAGLVPIQTQFTHGPAQTPQVWISQPLVQAMDFTSTGNCP